MNRIITIIFTLLFTLQASAQILVIPDIHGRSFWKNAVAQNADIPVIFLGDYLDPYSHEKISQEEALANFKDIIAFKQANKDRVTLLIGNHEIHYIDTLWQFGRKDTIRAEQIHKLITENMSLFSIASHAKINGKIFLFTHAGLLEPWWKKHFPNTPTDAQSVCNALNEKMKSMDTLAAFIDSALMDVSKLRKGEAEAGSCLWADVDEHNDRSDFFKGIYQVFGHSQQEKKPVIKKNFADLDCRKAFLITPQGKIKEIKKLRD